MICLNHEMIYCGRKLSLQKFYDLLDSYYAGFVPFGRPNSLIAVSQQSEAHQELLVQFLDWMCVNRDPNLKPERPAEDDEL